MSEMIDAYAVLVRVDGTEMSERLPCRIEMRMNSQGSERFRVVEALTLPATEAGECVVRFLPKQDATTEEWFGELRVDGRLRLNDTVNI
jgi:hypothetical protein